MKKKKIKLQKLSLQKKTIANVNSVQGGAPQTRFIVICNTITINTTILVSQPVVVCTFSKNDNKNCIPTEATCVSDCPKLCI